MCESSIVGTTRSEKSMRGWGVRVGCNEDKCHASLDGTLPGRKGLYQQPPESNK